MDRVVFSGTPKCCDHETYLAWLKVARVVPPGREGFCADCTKEFQAAHIKRGTCEHPYITFKNGDGIFPTAYQMRAER